MLQGSQKRLSGALDGTKSALTWGWELIGGLSSGMLAGRVCMGAVEGRSYPWPLVMMAF